MKATISTSVQRAHAVQYMPSKKVMRIRSGSGLGDALYLQSIVRHLTLAGAMLEVCTDWPDVFAHLPVRTTPFTRLNVDYVCHYVMGKRNTVTNQFQDMCIAIGLDDVELKLDWKIKNQVLVDNVRSRANGRPVCLIHGARPPMGRTDGFGAELLPDANAFKEVVRLLRDKYFTVRVGAGRTEYALDVHMDLSDATDVTDLFDLGLMADHMFAQCSFAIPLRESFDKSLWVMFARNGLNAKDPFVRAITPKKVLSKSTSRFVMDDSATFTTLLAMTNSVQVAA